MQYGILGRLELSDGGRAIEVAGAKRRAVLAVLLLNANRVVSSDWLIDALWDEHPPETARKSMQMHVLQLRKLLGPARLETRTPGYVLHVEPGELDLLEFEALVERAKDAPPAEASAILLDALALWRGPPLVDFALKRFAQAEITRLEEIRVEAVEDRLEAELALGGHRALVGALEALVDEYPMRERLREHLMLALYRSGRQASALESYHVGRRALVEGLGIEPGRSLRDLQQAILRQDESLDLAVAAPTEIPRSTFVGRTGELDQLSAGLDDAFGGRGRLFLLGGEPGIGKSRLAEELIAQARGRGAQILVGRCWEAGGAPAYWPWMQSLRSYAREIDSVALRAQLGRGAGELAQLLPELRQLLPGLPEPASIESESARFRLFDATTEFLRNASLTQPIVVVLDDLHAADTPSLLLLQFLARELGAARMLVLAVYRDVDPTPSQSLTTMLTEVAHEPATRRLSLGGLSENEIAEYVELAASGIASSELVAGLHEETEGNPLFVVETVRLLALEGLRPQSPGIGIAIPESVRDVIARRLTHLSETCNVVLEEASVLGREFALATLARISGVSEDARLEALDEAIAARVVSQVPGGTGQLRFAHVLIRDTLYEGLATGRRLGLHRLTVEALEARHGVDRGPHLTELAHHAIAGRDFEAGRRYATLAGDRSLALLAYEDAASLYETALTALDHSNGDDQRVRCELLLALGEARARAGNIPAAKAAFLAAAALARSIHAPRELALAAFGYGGRTMYERAGTDNLLVPLLEEALAVLDDDETALRARLSARLAGALRDEPSRGRRDELSSEAVELSRSTGDLAALAYALDGRAAAIMAPDTVSECFALASELQDVATRTGDKERIGHAHLHRLIAQIMTGDLGGAEADLDAMSALADELRQPSQLWQVTAAQAMLGLAAGRLTASRDLIARAFAVGERSEPAMAIPVFRLQRYTLFDFLGCAGEVEPEIRQLIAEYPARTALRCTLIHLTARLGQMDEAAHSLADLAEGDFAGLQFDNEWLYGTSLLAETCALVGDPGAADVLYRQLLPWAALNVLDHPEVIRGSVSRYLGLLAATLERWADASAHFDAALEMNERMRARPWLAHAQADYADMLLTRDEPGDRPRAFALLDEAADTYRELGMQRYEMSAATRVRDTRTAGR